MGVRLIVLHHEKIVSKHTQGCQNQKNCSEEFDQSGNEVSWKDYDNDRKNVS
jgi:hypothetical protein